MVSGGPRPPRLTSSKTVGFKTLVMASDPEFALRSQKVPEYEVTAPKKPGGVKVLDAYYKSRGPYAS